MQYEQIDSSLAKGAKKECAYCEQQKPLTDFLFDKLDQRFSSKCADCSTAGINYRRNKNVKIFNPIILLSWETVQAATCTMAHQRPNLNPPPLEGY